MSTFVIDTNVLMVASGRTPQAAVSCFAACVNALQDIQANHCTAVDDPGFIFAEYFRNLSRSGQPGLGAAFAKWLWDNQAIAQHCQRVTISVRDSDGRDIDEFPTDPRLKGFDPADKKFVAVALASGRNPQLLNATDPVYMKYVSVLGSLRVNVRELC